MMAMGNDVSSTKTAFSIMLLLLPSFNLKHDLFPAGDQLQAKCNQKGLEVQREELFSHHVAVCLPNNF